MDGVRRLFFLNLNNEEVYKVSNAMDNSFYSPYFY